MCNLSNGVEAKGIERGIKTNTLQSIQNLMDTLQLTPDQAMAALKIPEKDWEKYTTMLKQ